MAKYPEFVDLDNTTPECYQLFRFFSGHVHTRNLLYTELPAHVEKRARNDETKAERRSIEISLCGETTGISEAAVELLASSELRQGRPISYMYWDYIHVANIDLRINSWPISNYSMFKCLKHLAFLYIAKIKDKIIGLLEVAVIGGNAIVTFVVGNVHYWKDGVMNALFIRALGDMAARKRFFYGTDAFIGTPIEKFTAGLGITQVLKSK